MRQLAAMVGIGWMCVMGAGAQAQDGKALLDKTLKAYHDLSSYAGKLSTDVEVVAASGRKPLSATTADMLYKRPNKLTLKLSSRNTGDVEVYSDGSKLILYLDKYSKYSTGPTAPNLSAMLPLLRTRAGIDTMLDPLYFLSNTALPASLGNLKIQGSASVNGHPVTLVTGTLTADPPPSIARNVFLRKGARWTLYVDKSTYLLQKVEAQISGVLNQKVNQKGKVTNAKLAVRLAMRASVIDPKPNPPADDRSFVFTPPKGATEQKNVGDLLKNGTAAN